MTADIEALRAQFEREFRGVGAVKPPHRWEDGRYLHTSLQHAWDGYQAGHAAAAAETAAAVAAERDRCADIADQHASCEGIAQQIADAIRAGEPSDA